MCLNGGRNCRGGRRRGQATINDRRRSMARTIVGNRDL